MPATRATASTSPLVMAPRATSEVVSGCMCTFASGDGPPVTRLLRRDVDHAGPTERIEVGEAAVDMRESVGGGRDLGLWDATCASGAASAADLAHRAGRAHEVDLADAVARPLGRNAPLDCGRQLVVAIAGAQQRPQVDLVDREQARTQLAVGGEADPVAVAAEGPGDAGDDADLAATVGVAEPLGRLSDRAPAPRRRTGTRRAAPRSRPGRRRGRGARRRRRRGA